MAEPLSADEARRMRIVSIGMLAGVLVPRDRVARAPDDQAAGHAPRVLVRGGVCAVTPDCDHGGSRAAGSRDASARSPSPALSRHLIASATLEAAGFLCAAALMVGASLLPLAAAVVPVGAMLLRFPRASNAS
jgi:hypothetical protein